MAGWIKLYRSIQDHWIWDNPVYLKWWLDLILMANHKKNEVLVNGNIEVIEVGERLTSEVKLAERWEVDRKTVRKFLNLLEKEDMISVAKSRQKGTTYKVNKYKDYQQSLDGPKDIKRDNALHNDMDNAMDNGVDINKNEKNEKNEKKDVVVVDESKNVVKYYEAAFGMINPIMLENLNYWCEDLSTELVIEALKQSATSNAYSFKYTEKILRSWKKNKVKNLDDVKALDKKHVQQKSAKKTQQKNNKPQIQTNSEVSY